MQPAYYWGEDISGGWYWSRTNKITIRVFSPIKLTNHVIARAKSKGGGITLTKSSLTIRRGGQIKKDVPF